MGERYEIDQLYPNIWIRPTIPDSTESNNISFRPLCRYCNKDANKRELIRPCLCTDEREFVHIYCLEIMANVRLISRCAFCGDSFPLERKNKPLIEWCRNIRALRDLSREVCGSLLPILGLVIYNVAMVCLIGFLFTFVNFSKAKKVTESIFAIFLIIFLLAILMSPVVYEVKIVTALNKSLYQSCQQWCESNKEMKVIKKSRLHEAALL